MTSAFEAVVPVVAPYRLDLTVAVLRRFSTNLVDRTTADGRYARALAGFEGPIERIAGQVPHVPAGGLASPVVLTARQTSATELTVTFDGAPSERTRALALVKRMLGTERDMTHFHKAAHRVPWLRAFAARMRGVKPPRYPTLWEACVNAIVFQQISLSAAGAIVRRMILALGSPATYGELELYAFPSIERVLACDDATMRGFGLSGGKAATLRRAGEALLDGSLDEAMLESRSTPEASELLCGIKGIGPWTAAIVLLRGMGRLDLFPMKDSGVARSSKGFGDAVDVEAALRTLGDERGMLYYLLLLARLDARGELGEPAAFGELN